MKKNMVVFLGAFFLLMTISSHSSALTFTMPYDADLFFSPVGGEASHGTEFGIGNSRNNYTPYFTNLPNNPTPSFEVEAGMFLAGTDLQFYEATQNRWYYWAFSDATDQASLVAFTDVDNSLGFGGSVIEQTSISTWLLHLDDAMSFYDDDDNDVLIQIRLSAATPTPVPEPAAATMLLFGIGIAGLAGTRLRRKNSNRHIGKIAEPGV